jgi:hypothetical protein
MAARWFPGESWRLRKPRHRGNVPVLECSPIGYSADREVSMIRVLALLLVVAGCGGGGGGVSASQAKADCEAFISGAYCPKIVGCYAGQVTQADCVAAAQTGLDCAAVIGESGELNTCETQLGNSTCPVLVSSDGSVHIPAACMGVFLHP